MNPELRMVGTITKAQSILVKSLYIAAGWATVFANGHVVEILFTRHKALVLTFGVFHGGGDITSLIMLGCCMELVGVHHVTT